MEEINRNRLHYLFTRYIEKQSSAVELDEFLRYASDSRGRAEIEALAKELEYLAIVPEASEIDWEFIWKEAIKDNKNKSWKKRSIPVRFYWRAAASVLVILAGAAAFWYLSPAGKQDKPVTVKSTPRTTEIGPGQDGAILTLSDGRQIVLDSMGNGVIATQQGAEVLLKNGQLAYQSSLQGAEGEESPEVKTYNTLTTPRGRQFRLVLPDGSRVWLNALSRLHYPAVFARDKREIEISGEAYFEVVADKSRPFKVFYTMPTGERTKVDVLGTSFNINTYFDEPDSRTTLLEGSVKVIPSGEQEKPRLLAPGQQAVISARGADQAVSVISTDTEAAVAWKNGLFKFNSTDIRTMMRQMERWYDVKVDFPQGVPSDKFSGTLSRNVSLSQFLEILKYSDIEVKINGNTVTVIK